MSLYRPSYCLNSSFSSPGSILIPLVFFASTPGRLSPPFFYRAAPSLAALRLSYPLFRPLSFPLCPGHYAASSAFNQPLNELRNEAKLAPCLSFDFPSSIYICVPRAHNYVRTSETRECIRVSVAMRPLGNVYEPPTRTHQNSSISAVYMRYQKSEFKAQCKCIRACNVCICVDVRECVRVWKGEKRREI